MDEPISKILNGLDNAEEVKMDRWQLKVTRDKVVKWACGSFQTGFGFYLA